MKYAYLDKYGFLHINPNKETAKEFSDKGRVVETDFPEILGSPCDGTEAKVIPGGFDYSDCETYSVRSANEAYAVSDKLGKLYELVM